jgi:hypothetical protein
MHNEVTGTLVEERSNTWANASATRCFWFTFTYLPPAMLAGRKVAVHVS